MKLLSILLFVGIILHQISLPKVNSLLLIELGLLALFYFVGGKMFKEWRRKQEVKSYLKGISKKYLSKTEPKTWRGRTNTEVQIEKETYWDKI